MTSTYHSQLETTESLAGTKLAGFIAQQRLLIGEEDRPELLQFPNGDLSKAFYPRKTWFKSRRITKSRQFVKNGKQLKSLNINAPYAKHLVGGEHDDINFVTYEKLLGVDMRSIEGERLEQALDDLTSYLPLLHDKGIIFRAIHLGNILVMPNKEMGLVDIADLRIVPGPLNNYWRFRNLVHLLKKADDHQIFSKYGFQKFVDNYHKQAGLNIWSRRCINSALSLRFRNEFWGQFT